MIYTEAKIYSDGSHYIAIPHTVRPRKIRRKRREEVITIKCKSGAISPLNEENENIIERITTKKELFNEIYAETVYMKKRERKKKIMETLSSHFESEEKVKEYIKENTERKKRNLLARKIRLSRKMNLQEFNYFVTFTYDGNLHTEESFRKKLKNCLSHLSSRKSWRYIGVWERSPEKERLHFHGIFYVANGSVPGEIKEVSGYSFTSRRRQITHQSEYFKRKFGRNDFSKIEDREGLNEAVGYILKYIEKSGEKLVYSRGLSQYFISDVMEEDIVCKTGQEDKKLLLFDDFRCIDEGEIIGRVSKEVIRKMRRAN